MIVELDGTLGAMSQNLEVLRKEHVPLGAAGGQEKI